LLSSDILLDFFLVIAVMMIISNFIISCKVEANGYSSLTEHLVMHDVVISKEFFVVESEEGFR
jgi:hypothetical protein